MDPPMEFEVTMADIAKTQRRPPPSADLCKRCQELPPAVTTRNEALCPACFTTYLRTKFTRHMEPFRVKPGTEVIRRKLLLATSFGVASTVLLDLLHWHRSLQLQRARRAEYDIIVVHIDETSVLGGDSNAATQRLDLLRKRYDQFEFRCVPLQQVYEGQSPEEQTDVPLEEDAEKEGSPIQRLRALLASLNSRASQMDIISLLRARLLLEVAQAAGCEVVLLADSMTRMAAMVLAEVTKGRGHALPWLISDGPTPYGTPLVRPLRDLSTNELSHYLTFASLWEFTTVPAPSPSTTTATATAKPPTAAKNQTIEEVMLRFFDDVSNTHLSANVVRTAAKLHFPDDHDRIQRLGLCDTCGLPMDEDPKLRLARARGLPTDVQASSNVDEPGEQAQAEAQVSGGVNELDEDARIYCLEPPPGQEGLKQRRCYACRRSTLDAGTVDWPVKNR
ncbi:hypothetical protein DRE_02255 [Drechslerella stenobrocha 248]|uniref:Cytoplasmic tRNA 2-thiolation protein 2 n=1 Tax=Drechslerella stenobrocha 248 TaxID=1043628 RepID=W7HVD8_9PEZI|nr:hypothetical protein DRE_02255 [Drechslerella stenobrocha 248]